MRTVTADYNAFLASARAEMRSMTNQHHTRVISRIGHASEDIKELQIEISNSIQIRAIEINRNDTDCIQMAEERLETAAKSFGKVVIAGAQEWYSLNDYLVDVVIYETIDELQLAVWLMEAEFLNVFARMNAVTSMYELLLSYQTIIISFSNQFELYVYEVYVNMFLYHVTTNYLDRDVFHSFDRALEEFRVEGNSIIDSLTECN
jgi:hypothetical protein